MQKKLESFLILIFYLAEKIPDSHYSQIRCIDDSIGEGYSHLSLPLIEMNLQLDALTSEE